LRYAGRVESRPRRERADAARNRERVLTAAARLLADDPQATTMDQIARAAGVGKGTLYRRYPSKTALAAALLGEHERALQDAILRGPPPLGPGAVPEARLRAFYAASVELLEHHGHLSQAIETTGERLGTGAHAAWRAHVAMLAREAGTPADPDVLADQLLAPLAPDLYAYQRRVLGRRPDEILDALGALAAIMRS
jgi:AcrR family transcriptional regulator